MYQLWPFDLPAHVGKDLRAVGILPVSPCGKKQSNKHAAKLQALTDFFAEDERSVDALQDHVSRAQPDDS